MAATLPRPSVSAALCDVVWSSDATATAAVQAIVAIATMCTPWPIAAMLISSPVANSREFVADRTGAKIGPVARRTRAALKRIEVGREADSDDANQQPAHRFILSPFSGGVSVRCLHAPPTQAAWMTDAEQWAAKRFRHAVAERSAAGLEGAPARFKPARAYEGRATRGRKPL